MVLDSEDLCGFRTIKQSHILLGLVSRSGFSNWNIFQIGVEFVRNLDNVSVLFSSQLTSTTACPVIFPPEMMNLSPPASSTSNARICPWATVHQ